MSLIWWGDFQVSRGTVVWGGGYPNRRLVSQYGKAAHSRQPNIRFLDRRTVETVGFRQLNKFTIYNLQAYSCCSCSPVIKIYQTERKNICHSRRFGLKTRGAAEPAEIARRG